MLVSSGIVLHGGFAISKGKQGREGRRREERGRVPEKPRTREGGS